MITSLIIMEARNNGLSTVELARAVKSFLRETEGPASVNDVKNIATRLVEERQYNAQLQDVEAILKAER